MTNDWIPLSDPDISIAELDAVSAVLQTPRLSNGPAVAAFEAEFAAYLGRQHAVAVASGTAGLLLCLRAYGIGPGRETANATSLSRGPRLDPIGETANATSLSRGARLDPVGEVIVSPYSWHQIAHAVALAGATPVFADIDYWSGTLAPEKVQAKITAQTRAIIAGNTNGHPAA